MERIPEKIDRFGELPPPKKNGMAYLLGSCPDACGYQNWRSRAIVLSGETLCMNSEKSRGEFLKGMDLPLF